MIDQDFEEAAYFWRTGTFRERIHVNPEDSASVREGWSGIAFYWDPFGVNILRIGNREFERGWGVCCPKGHGVIQVDLPAPARKLSVKVGVQDHFSTRRNQVKMSFRILDEAGLVLAETPLLAFDQEPFLMQAELDSAKVFRLEACADNDCSAVWAEPVIEYVDGTSALPGTRTNPTAFLGLEFQYARQKFDPALWAHRLEKTNGIYRHFWCSPDGRLELKAEARIHEQYHVIEVVPHLSCIGTEPTQLIEDFHGLCFRKSIVEFPHSGGAANRIPAPLLQPELQLHRNRGSQATGTDFLRFDDRLSNRHGMREVVSDTDEGRSSSAWLPFFQVELIDDRRIDFAVNWSGAWRASVKFISDETFEVTAGLKRTHFRLLPGEQIRQVGFAAHFAVADEAGCANEFRRFMTACKIPRDAKGELLLPPASVMFSGTTPNQTLLDYLDVFDRNSVPIEVWWIDAGWYGPDRNVPLELHQSDWGNTVGNWHVNQVPHPGGFKPVQAELHKRGRRLLLWVEIERADRRTPITNEHPEYFIQTNSDNFMLDMGNEAACDWAIETISRLMEEEKIDCYREDFNFNTIPYWDAADTEDRIGVSEARFVTGFYRFWETLRRRYPNLLIDNCASGGRRIDIATLELSIPLWRSDFQCFPDIPQLPEANQIHFDGLSRWVPFHSCGTVLRPYDEYAFVSGALGSPLVDLCNRRIFGPDERDFDFAWLSKMMKLALAMRKHLHGDYFAMTDHPEDFRNFYAYQLAEYDGSAGVAVIFRRAATPGTEFQLNLKNLTDRANYEWVDMHGKKFTGTGLALRNLIVPMPEPRSCQVFLYRRIG